MKKRKKRRMARKIKELEGLVLFLERELMRYNAERQRELRSLTTIPPPGVLEIQEAVRRGELPTRRVGPIPGNAKDSVVLTPPFVTAAKHAAKGGE